MNANTMNHEEMSHKVQSHEEILIGKNGEPGIAHKVGFMWRVQVWAIGIIGAACGFLFKAVFDALAAWHGHV